MNEWWLLACFIGLVLLALPIMLYPMRQSKGLAACCVFLIMSFVSVTYWYWGGWFGWINQVHSEDKKQQVQALLRTIKNPSELVEKLKNRLKDNPESARGWYLLGRLYVSENQWSLARDAFAKSHQLEPDDEAVTVNYAQSLWQLNQQQFNDQIRTLFEKLLQKNPNQPDALAMLAMDAYMRHDYLLAIHYWQHLLKLAPEQSEEAQAIQKAIVKAQKRL
jgi:cytochrome c-type biogenesis protein CcmH/NrfG